MKAFVDPELCIGCTQCAGLCPEVYQMEGTLAVAIPGDIPPDQVPLAVDAANACPVSAIRVECKRSPYYRDTLPKEGFFLKSFSSLLFCAIL